MGSDIIQPHGGYENLLSYRKSVIVYDGTVCFCRRFLSPKDRTYDQMIQAARSGKQNIVEGSMAGITSSEMEIKLTGVARASLEELLEDYKDYLRVNGHLLWPKDSKASLAVRRIRHSPNESYQSYASYLEERSPETCANIMICLINQANYLLDKQLQSLTDRFVQQGGLRERMFNARQNHKKNR